MDKDPSGRYDLVSILSEIPDPRVDRRRLHKLEDILTIALCATICGADTFVDMEVFGESKEGWFSSFLELPNGIPSHDTFRAVFMAVDPREFLGAFTRWTETVREAFSQEVVAVDGKALRAALDKGQNPRYIVGAWATENGLALGQLKVAEKSNEITAVPELLRLLALEGCIVTLDAMGCQKAAARDIVDRGADYVLALKGNQGKLHAQVATYFEGLLDGGLAPDYSSTETGHGRTEVRRCWAEGELAPWLLGRRRARAVA